MHIDGCGEKETPLGEKETPLGEKETPLGEKETPLDEKVTIIFNDFLALAALISSRGGRWRRGSIAGSQAGTTEAAWLGGGVISRSSCTSCARFGIKHTFVRGVRVIRVKATSPPSLEQSTQKSRRFPRKARCRNGCSILEEQKAHNTTVSSVITSCWAATPLLPLLVERRGRR